MGLLPVPFFDTRIDPEFIERGFSHRGEQRDAPVPHPKAHEGAQCRPAHERENGVNGVRPMARHGADQS